MTEPPYELEIRRSRGCPGWFAAIWQRKESGAFALVTIEAAPTRTRAHKLAMDQLEAIGQHKAAQGVALIEEAAGMQEAVMRVRAGLRMPRRRWKR